MKRRTFDILVAVAGLFLALTLVASGGLLTWAHNFIGNKVRTQLHSNGKHGADGLAATPPATAGTSSA